MALADVPEDHFYSDDHECVHLAAMSYGPSETVRVEISRFAVDSLGDVRALAARYPLYPGLHRR